MYSMVLARIFPETLGTGIVSSIPLSSIRFFIVLETIATSKEVVNKWLSDDTILTAESLEMVVIVLAATSSGCFGGYTTLLFSAGALYNFKYYVQCV